MYHHIFITFHERPGVLNHWQPGCLFNINFQDDTKNPAKLHITEALWGTTESRWIHLAKDPWWIERFNVKMSSWCMVIAKMAQLSSESPPPCCPHRLSLVQVSDSAWGWGVDNGLVSWKFKKQVEVSSKITNRNGSSIELQQSVWWYAVKNDASLLLKLYDPENVARW